MASLKDGSGDMSSVSLDQEIETMVNEEPSLQPETEVVSEVRPPDPDEGQRQPALRKPGQVNPEGKINLDSLPEFRNYKSAKDREVEAERQARIQAEQQVEQIRQAQQNAQLSAYQQQLQSQLQSYDPEQQKAAVQQLAALQAQQYLSQMQAWENAKRKRLSDEGLDPNDARFNKQYPGGEAGLRQFENEIATVKNELLVKENKELKSSVGNIDTIVKQKVAEALRAMGFDTPDVGDTATPSDAGSRHQQDMRRLQLGQMDREEFIKKYG